jgi:pSer/pThr/pTyr-binding forkhead associated (FHA) protein
MATLQRLGDKTLCPLNLNQIGIGRAIDNEIVIDDESVSGYHALISVKESSKANGPDEFIIEDLDSTNKTFVNTKQITREKLTNGDIIRIGLVRLKFSTKAYQAPQTDYEKTTEISRIKSGYKL